MRTLGLQNPPEFSSLGDSRLKGPSPKLRNGGRRDVLTNPTPRQHKVRLMSSALSGKLAQRGQPLSLRCASSCHRMETGYHCRPQSQCPNKGGNHAATFDLLCRRVRFAVRRVCADTCVGILLRLPSPLSPLSPSPPLLPLSPSRLLPSPFLLLLAVSDFSFQRGQGRSAAAAFSFSEAHRDWSDARLSP